MAMHVDRRHGRCRACGGALDIVDADDATMTVECQEVGCGECYAVEPDAFGDGCMLLYLSIMAGRLEGNA